MALFSDDEDYQDDQGQNQQPLNTLDHIDSSRNLYNNIKNKQGSSAAGSAGSQAAAKGSATDASGKATTAAQGTAQEAGKKTVETAGGTAEKSSLAAGASSGNAATAAASAASIPILIIIAIVIGIILLIFFLIGVLADLTSFSTFDTATSYIDESKKKGIDDIKSFLGKFSQLFDNTEWIEADENEYDPDNEFDVGYITTYNLINTMLNKAYSKTTPEDKARINSEKCIGENETCFYSSLEIKDTGMFKLRMDKTNEQERGTINSRVIGSLIGCGGVYAVYHTGKRPIKWAKSVEGQMAYAISVIARDQYNGNVPAGSIKECIVIGYTNEVFYKIATSENNAVLGLNNGYKSLYAIPYDKNGLTIIQQMIKPEWREKMKKRVLPDHDHVTNNLGIEADGIRGAEIAFLFCIPDLSRLCRFLAALAFSAGQITGEMHYVIYCFDFQKELVEQLNDGLAEIRTVGLEKAILPS